MGLSNRQKSSLSVVHSIKRSRCANTKYVMHLVRSIQSRALNLAQQRKEKQRNSNGLYDYGSHDNITIHTKPQTLIILHSVRHPSQGEIIYKLSLSLQFFDAFCPISQIHERLNVRPSALMVDNFGNFNI